jgi:hypothetical protein
MGDLAGGSLIMNTMKSLIISSCMAMVAFVFAATKARAEQSLPDFANRAMVAVDNNLKSCGLLMVDPHTPGLPNNNRWEARYAVVNHRGQALAYFVQTYGGLVSWAWMNPNGGFLHSIQFDNYSVSFGTPLGGNVATASRYVTPSGVAFNFYCRSAGGMVPTFQMFEACVERDFVQVLSHELCRFSN